MTKHKAMNQFYSWIGAWIGIAQSIVTIISLGFYIPSWEILFLIRNSKRQLKTSIALRKQREIK